MFKVVPFVGVVLPCGREIQEGSWIKQRQVERKKQAWRSKNDHIHFGRLGERKREGERKGLSELGLLVCGMGLIFRGRSFLQMFRRASGEKKVKRKKTKKSK